MIEEVTIENYKSIQSLTLPLGRVTVLIGENGCGKSNILEAIALGSVAAGNNNKNLLAGRGIRLTEAKLMRSCFQLENATKNIKTSFKFDDNQIFYYDLSHDNNPYSQWEVKTLLSENLIDQLIGQLATDEEQEIFKELNELNELKDKMLIQVLTQEKDSNNYPNPMVVKAFNTIKMITIQSKINKSEELKTIYFESFYYQWMANFYIFCPQFIGLRNFEEDENNLPLGVNGEGLFKYIKYLGLKENQKEIIEIKEKLELIDWFEDFDVPDNLYPGEKTLKIKDRYLDPDLEYFDQKSANEGFLFLLFYFCLFIGEETPRFFAIDNIDSSLNPRLCSRLVEELVELAKKHDKQVILTTHNPAILDGLDLHDDEQKLYVIRRKLNGETRADRVSPLKPPKGKDPVRLSEAFLRGYIGGLPENF
ncbi:MAG: AAA family ATPase [Snowella sp.]|nr:AAA family ATPase [Snowella sp.]